MERLRRVARAGLGVDSALYRTLAGVADLLAVARSDGLPTWRLLRRLARTPRDSGPPVPVGLRTLAHPILIRPGTDDVRAVLDNIVREEYGDFRAGDAPAWMIDAGAYIGDTAAYFLSRFARLHVVALEPNPPSHALARRNLEPYGDRATLLACGLSGSGEPMRVDGRETGASLAPSEDGIPCTTVPALLDRFGIARLDILKLDVEGAEESIFREAADVWLPRVDRILIEIHGPDILAVVSRALRENGFSMRRRRSVWYCVPAVR